MTRSESRNLFNWIFDLLENSSLFNSWTSSPIVTKYTLNPWLTASIPRPTAKNVFSTPGGPKRIRLYCCSSQLSCFNCFSCRAVSAVCSSKLNSERDLMNGNRAHFIRLSKLLASRLARSWFVMALRNSIYVQEAISASLKICGRASAVSARRSCRKSCCNSETL